MKTTAILLSALTALSFASCKKNIKTPGPEENTVQHCYQVYNAVTGKAIEGAEITFELETTEGVTDQKTIYTNKQGNACEALPPTEEFYYLQVKAPGYLTERFGENRSSIALIKPYTLRLHIRKSDENKAGDLLIIDYRISSGQSEQILLKGKTDTTIIKQADPRGKSLRWIYNNIKDSVLLDTKSGEIRDVSLVF